MRLSLSKLRANDLWANRTHFFGESRWSEFLREQL